jgi:hypothetical protein
VLAFVAVGLILLWTQTRDGADRNPVAPAVVEPIAPPPVAALPDSAATADSLRAASAAADSSLVASADAPALTEDASPPSAPASPEPAAPSASERLPDTAAGGGSGGGIPPPLRGPGGVDPARGGATWVLGSGSRSGADRDLARYRRLGYRADVLTGRTDDRTVHRVVVGQFRSFEEAVQFRSSLPPGAPAGAWVLRLE